MKSFYPSSSNLLSRSTGSKNQLSEVEHQRFRQNLTKHLQAHISHSKILQEDESADFMRLVDTYAVSCCLIGSMVSSLDRLFMIVFDISSNAHQS
jgi:hypothetical protein